MQHNLYIVALSVVVSIVYTFVALDFARRSNRKTMSSRCLWLFSASLTMGIGIWGTHFVGLMSVNMSLTAAHHIPAISQCMLIAVAGTYGAFYFTKSFHKKSSVFLSAFFMGSSIIALHYFGMKTAAINSNLHYDFFVSTLAAAAAYLFSGIALYRQFSASQPSLFTQFINSLFMVLALTGLHYIGEKAMLMKSHHIFLVMHDPRLGSLSLIATAIVIVASLFIALLYVLGAMSDQQLKLKSLQLDESEQRNHSLIALNPDGVYMIGKDRKITGGNHSLEKITGYSADELQGSLYTFLLAPSEAERTEEFFQRTLAGEPIKRETRIKHKNGTEFEAEITNIPYFVENKLIGIIGTIKDLTEFRRMEKKLRLSEKLAVVGELAAGVAHEIRNPLTSLKGFTQMFKDHPNIPVREEYLNIMLEEIESINLITNEFMVLAKPHLTMTKQIDLLPLIKQVTLLLTGQASLNNTQIETQFYIDSGTVKGEENQLKKVFVNVIKNAIEAMPDGGKVTITVTGIQNENLLIQIKDEGVGISEVHLRQLFLPFFTTKENGKGLGLMVSQKILDNHMGHLRFTSTLGEGTLAEITLPAEAVKELSSPTAS